MKNLKKIIFAVLMIFIAGAVINVNASLPPYYWYSDGKDVTENNASAELIRDGKIHTLKLNNYNGKGIKLECLGSGQDDMEFIIELTGDNVITDTNIGIDFPSGGNNRPIQFKGDGTLKINAPKPISYESYENTMIIKPASNIYTDKEEIAKDEEVKEEKEETNEEVTDEVTTIGTTSDNNLVMYICFGAYAVLTLIIIIILSIALAKKNKKEVM